MMDCKRALTESNGDMDIGVKALPGGAGRQNVPALVRVTVVARGRAIVRL